MTEGFVGPAVQLAQGSVVISEPSTTRSRIVIPTFPQSFLRLRIAARCISSAILTQDLSYVGSALTVASRLTTVQSPLPWSVTSSPRRIARLVR